MRLGDTPVPIPNTMVKTQAADGTLLETVRESRWMPGSWGYSSVGRAPALQAGGHEFESRYLHEDFFGSSAEGAGWRISLLIGARQRLWMNLQNIRERGNRRFPSATCLQKNLSFKQNNMYLENCILKMIRHQTVNKFTNTFFNHKNDRPINVTLYIDVVMLQRAQGGCLGTESRRKT